MIFRGRRIRRLVKLLRDCWQQDTTEESALDTCQKQAFSPPSSPADRIWRQNNLLHNRHRGRVRLKYDGTRWRTGGEVKGKLANGVGSQYSHNTSDLVYQALLTLTRTTRLQAVDWKNAPADLNGLVRFGERRNLVSARVPSRFKRTTRFLQR